MFNILSSTVEHVRLLSYVISIIYFCAHIELYSARNVSLVSISNHQSTIQIITFTMKIEITCKFWIISITPASRTSVQSQH